MDANFSGFRHGAWTVILLGLTGCKKDGSLWLLLFEPNTDPSTCDMVVTHNFNDATQPEEAVVDESWLITSEMTMSDSAVIGEVTGGPDPVLVISSRLWTGTTDGSTTTFVWKSEETSSTTQSSTTSEYDYTDNYSQQVDEKIKLEFKGNEASGTYTTTQTLNHSWSETDSFDSKVVGSTYGQIPSYAYLLIDGPHGKQVPVYNMSKEAECATAVCLLTLVSTCDSSVKVTATEIDVDDDNYDGIGGAWRPAGVPGYGDDTGWLE